MEAAQGWILAPAPAPGLALRVAPGLPAPVVDALVDLLGRDGVTDLPRLGTSRRALVGRLVVEGRAWVVKRYLNPRLFLLRTLGQRSKAEREAEALRLIAARTGNPIQAVAWGERRVLGMVSVSWLVTSELTDAVDLRRLRRSDDPAERAWVKQVVLRDLPARLAGLHRAGIAAGNLMAKNVLLQRGTETLALIDQPHARAWPRLSERQRLWDLACLFRELRHGLSEEETRAFLRDYLATLGAEPAALPAAESRLARAVARRAHETPLRRLWHAARGWFKRTRVGELATGHRYPEDQERAA